MFDNILLIDFSPFTITLNNIHLLNILLLSFFGI